ncbi:MAG: hypothetical protein ACF8Q5_05880 [Phycisphaerales bacterium JB040]
MTTRRVLGGLIAGMLSVWTPAAAQSGGSGGSGGAGGTTGVNVQLGTGSSGGGYGLRTWRHWGGRLTAPTLPYRDPWLDPRYRMDYVEPESVEDWIEPASDWQIGVPVFLGGELYYVVRDAESYVAQFSQRVADYYEALPVSVTGLRVDLVRDVREPLMATTHHYGFGTPTYLRIGDYSFETDRPYYWGGTLGDRIAAGRVMPWFWYWLDWSGEELDRLSAIRGSYVGPIDGQFVPGYVPIEAIPEPEPAPTTRELAVSALASGDTGEAVALLLAHLALPEGKGDWAARRLLAVALVGERRTSDAASFMRLSYLGDPALAFEPIGDTPGVRWRDLLQEAGRHANQMDSASGWFLLGVLLHEQGRTERALEMVGRAEAWGLEAKVSDAVRAAWGP